MSLALDVLVAIGLLVLGVQVVAGRAVFRSIVMFVVFGLLMALAWGRLGSADLALAEAAVGAGLTGAMFLLTYRRLIEIKPERAGQTLLRRSAFALPVAALSSLLVIGVAWTLWAVPAPDATAGHAALHAMESEAVGNPVTGVLLLFRGYDTLLEMVVLMIAWLGVKMVQPVARPTTPDAPANPPLLNSLLAAVIPSVVLVGGYLLHAGGQAPGGAFQAGAVVAAGGVLLVLSGRLRPMRDPRPLQRFALVVGIFVFSVLALAGVAHGRAVMELPGLWAVYAIEGALTVSIAMSLVLLFIGSGGLARRRA
jgi:multisubunit Na+/H+ antiporter MnhB subunit